MKTVYQFIFHMTIIGTSEIHTHTHHTKIFKTVKLTYLLKIWQPNLKSFYLSLVDNESTSEN